MGCEGGCLGPLFVGRRPTWACAPGVGKPARSPAEVAGGRCGRKATGLASGVGRAEREGRLARGVTRGRADVRAQAVRVRGRGAGPRGERAEAGPCGAGSSGRRAGWGGKGAGPCGASGSGPKRGNKLGLGLPWAGIWGWLGFLGRVWFSIFLLFFFLNLIQTKFEFKFEFEFKPHSNKSMHQHECNNKNLNL